MSKSIAIKDQIEALFLKHYKEWCLLSYSYLGDISASEDVVQDACIKILNRKKENEIKDLKSYISVAIRNLSLKRIQSAKRFKDLQEDRVVSTALSHEEFLIDEENRIRLQKAVDVLPVKSKKVFELCVLEGIKYKNTAEVLGISINTVKFHLKKSFKLLRLELQDAF